MPKSDHTNSLLRVLPSVDSILKTATAMDLSREAGSARMGALARRVTNELRMELLAKSAEPEVKHDGAETLRKELLSRAEQRLLELHRNEKASSLRRVINATGVVLHTNLGRAPLSKAARQAIDAAAGYCSLEYDVLTGARGRRGPRAEDLLVNLTGAEASLIVNNCAAAALLVLSTFARDGETIVSRGELVEIGGDFRVPEVMAQSGTRMVEVGTTNRTSLNDYRQAISDKTRLLMRVHTSNYRIVGFAKTPALSELAELAHDANLPLYEDAGSGALLDLSESGIDGEPIIRESLGAGADIVTFSGDKLLGGPQAGLIAGRRELIEQMRRNPLYRALRADKLRLAALEATLEAYARGEGVPAQESIAMTASEINARAERMIDNLSERISPTLSLEKIEGESAVGGGSAPTSPLRTVLIAVNSSAMSSNDVEAALRQWEPPIVVCIIDDRVVIDLRTVAGDEEIEIQRALSTLS